jgi:2-polyprenyl-6-methoxyphenol hydroxylase-like FAD-dependent oxidoreductase
MRIVAMLDASFLATSLRGIRSMYDVIVIGARVAGSATAMMLARGGLKVLAVDRAAFPSDTLSTHQVQLPGIARLERWDLLSRIVAAGTPATRRVRFDAGPVVLTGTYPVFDGVDALFSPRRTLLDSILVEAAREAGAEVREQFVVQDLVFTEGRVTGIRGRGTRGGSVVEQAKMVVGADGRHSLLAKAVIAGRYHDRPALTFGYYTYWDGLPLDGGEIYGRGRRFIGAWPTNDGLVMTYVGGPIDEFHAFRADLETNLLASLDLAGDLGERARSARRAERIYGTADTANYFRKSYGAGWALVGDAGLAMDPVTGQGISDALRDAELLAGLIRAAASDGRPLDSRLDGYERARNAAVKPMYDFTIDLASFPAPRFEQQMLFAALASDPQQTQQFLGVLAGAVPIDEFFAPRNLRRLIGLRGFAKIAGSKLLRIDRRIAA